jgi:hypothetical protein
VLHARLRTFDIPLKPALTRLCDTLTAFPSVLLVLGSEFDQRWDVQYYSSLGHFVYSKLYLCGAGRIFQMQSTKWCEERPMDGGWQPADHHTAHSPQCGVLLPTITSCLL